MKLLSAVFIFLFLGCADEPTTQADLLHKQVRAEQQMRSCTNSGGVWYGTIRSGRCDWNPMLRLP